MDLIRRRVIYMAPFLYTILVLLFGFGPSIGAELGVGIGVFIFLWLSDIIYQLMKGGVVKTRSIFSDDRALGVGLFIFMAMLMITAFLYILLDPAFDMLHTMVSGHTTDAEAQTVVDRRHTIFNLFPYFALFLSGIFIIARSVFESRRPG